MKHKMSNELCSVSTLAYNSSNYKLKHSKSLKGRERERKKKHPKPQYVWLAAFTKNSDSVHRGANPRG